MSQLYITINRLYSSLPRRNKRWIFRLLDCFVVALSIYLAFCLRFDIFQSFAFLSNYRPLLLVVIPIKICFFWLVGMYRPVLRYVGTEFLNTAIKGVVGSTGLIALSAFIFNLPQFPRSVLIIDAFLTLFGVITTRILIRWFLFRTFYRNDAENAYRQERIVVYGAGATGTQLVQALVNNRLYRVVAFVDDNVQLQKQEISNVKIYSPAILGELIERFSIDTILMAIPSAGKKRSYEIVKRIGSLGVRIKTIPDVADIISGKVSVNEIRDIDIADLLGREEVEPIENLLRSNVVDKTVMVTGAGGSIGSELCRQICLLEPQRLILLERNEYALYSIDIELRETYPNIEIVPCLGSVTISDRMEKVMRKYEVDTIYHAAAYKHVPLVEENIVETLYNNVIGTLKSVEVAGRLGVSTFVLISTDKAVRPTSVMGATKRVAELILQAYAQKEPVSTRFVMVRFGNVLDSAGSVVPRFRKQIAEGKNITVTHKDITRYFMSISEASRLVIQAGALGEGGDVFLLDMGEPIRIYDLALQMIELSGLRLKKDIDIEFTGLRPGEKLYEELLIDKTNGNATIHPKIFSAKEVSYSWEELSEKLDSLFAVAKSEDRAQIVEKLQDILPEFQPEKSPLEKQTGQTKSKVVPFSSHAS